MGIRAASFCTKTSKLQVALAGAILCSLIPLQTHGQSRQKQELQKLEVERQTREKRAQVLEKTADQAAAEIINLRNQLVNAALVRDRMEKSVERSETRLKTLRRNESMANARFMARRQALEDVIIALIAVERDRPPALAIRPTNATEAARVAILMRLVAPQLDKKAREIAAEIGQLRQVRQDILMSNRDYREATQNLITARASVGGLIAKRQELEVRLRRDAQAERSIISQIANRASSLRDLIAQLGDVISSTNKSGPSFARGFEIARGKLLRPANGQVVTNFGADLAEGGKASGITIRTRARAQVVSPYDGRIEFAAPFRSYGRVLIINVGTDYRLVLAGLGNSYVQAGQEVLAGEPLGEMTSDASIIPDLYVEIRRGEATLDPSQWLAGT
ncbi:MAG: peptidase M23B [Hyphomonadaceae bacterium]|nr:MAG: peptidase M23B [Hyphomonadaceae bacterium]